MVWNLALNASDGDLWKPPMSLSTHLFFQQKKQVATLPAILFWIPHVWFFFEKKTKRFQTNGSNGSNVSTFGVVDACIFAFAPLVSYENRLSNHLENLMPWLLDAHHLHSRSPSSPKIPFYLFPLSFQNGFFTRKKNLQKIRTWGFSPICHYRILGHLSHKMDAEAMSNTFLKMVFIKKKK